MNVTVCTVTWGGWYPLGVARMIREFDRFCLSPVKVQAWVNVLPPGTPELIEDGHSYTGYAAKPYALKYALESGADVAILIDASVYPIKEIWRLVGHIVENGYYLAPTGDTVGEWTSDRMLNLCGMSRDKGCTLPMIASGVVGWTNSYLANTVVEEWCKLAPHFPGHHSNTQAADKSRHYKNRGWVSDDPRCSGHRHDQSALSIVAHRMGLTKLTPWPRFVAYKAGYGGFPDETTVLEIGGRPE